MSKTLRYSLWEARRVLLVTAEASASTRNTISGVKADRPTAAQGGTQSPRSLKFYNGMGTVHVRVCQRHPPPHTLRSQRGLHASVSAVFPWRHSLVFTKEAEGRKTFMACYLISERNLNRWVYESFRHHALSQFSYRPEKWLEWFLNAISIVLSASGSADLPGSNIWLHTLLNQLGNQKLSHWMNDIDIEAWLLTQVEVGKGERKPLSLHVGKFF